MRCEKCGNDFDAELGRCPKCGASVEFSGNTKFFQRAKESHVRFREIFSGTFKRHPAGTAGKIFAAGTPETTPTPDKMLAVWQRPWLYSRFLLVGIAFVIISLFTVTPVMWSFGSLVLPFAMLMFIWEMNIPRDISFVKVLAYFAVGGMLSILFTLILSIFFDYDAPIAAFVEEPAKLFVTLILISRTKPKYGFGGMLIGAAVGTGFEVFENISYVFAQGNDAEMFLVFLMRSIMALGGHIVWAAIAGAAVVLSNDKRGKAAFLRSPLFYGCFFAGIFLHFTWNGGLIYLFELSDFACVVTVPLLVTVAGLAILFLLMNKCLKQVVKAYDDARALSQIRSQYPDNGSLEAAQVLQGSSEAQRGNIPQEPEHSEPQASVASFGSAASDRQEAQAAPPDPLTPGKNKRV